MSSVECKDCVAEGITTKRKLAVKPDGTLQPGPRCVTHHRAVKKARSQRAHGLKVEATYGITAEEYWYLYERQGGVCAICQRAKGLSKRLCVDHDHDCTENWDNTPGGHDPKQGCRLCVRALVCNPCNELLGKYPPVALARAITVKVNPPAQQYLMERDEREWQRRQ